MDKNYRLTDAEANLIKDILRIIGDTPGLEVEISGAIGMPYEKFADSCDTIFTKLGNGRVIAKTSVR